MVIFFNKNPSLDISFSPAEIKQTLIELDEQMNPKNQAATEIAESCFNDIDSKLSILSEDATHTKQTISIDEIIDSTAQPNNPKLELVLALIERKAINNLDNLNKIIKNFRSKLFPQDNRSVITIIQQKLTTILATKIQNAIENNQVDAPAEIQKLFTLVKYFAYHDSNILIHDARNFAEQLDTLLSSETDTGKQRMKNLLTLYTNRKPFAEMLKNINQLVVAIKTTKKATTSHGERNSGGNKTTHNLSALNNPSILVSISHFHPKSGNRIKSREDLYCCGCRMS